VVLFREIVFLLFSSGSETSVGYNCYFACYFGTFVVTVYAFFCGQA